MKVVGNKDMIEMIESTKLQVGSLSKFQRGIIIDKIWFD